MTERAKRAADELTRRGWMMDKEDDDGLDKECQQCGQQIPGDARYCQHCGTRVAAEVAQGSLADLEAAIAAAVDSKADAPANQEPAPLLPSTPGWMADADQNYLTVDQCAARVADALRLERAWFVQVMLELDDTADVEAILAARINPEESK